ncbi:MAG: hypothetical protein JWO36_4783, partial [Myxococcales bacterium]|nr:hypothetical protein [Myxococcales bacterium]
MATPFPFDRIPKLTRDQARSQSAVARWLGARSTGNRLGKLVGAVRVTAIASAQTIDPYAATCEVRVFGESIEVHGSSAAIRRITQQLLGGAVELPAPRPLGSVEQAIWALVVATALEDLGIAGEVWPRIVAEPRRAAAIEITVDVGGSPLTITAGVPAAIELRATPRPPPAWAERAMLDVPIVLGRCAFARAAIGSLAVRDVITLEPPRGAAELALLGGAIGLSAAPDAVVAEVATEYGRRDMSLPDDAHVELTVALGTTQLSLRQVFELSIGQVVQL